MSQVPSSVEMAAVPPLDLATLGEDALERIATLCSPESVRRLGSTCSAMRPIGTSPTVWTTLLRRNFDMHVPVASPAELHRRLECPQDWPALRIVGVFTDGGVDDVSSPPLSGGAEGASSSTDVPNTADLTALDARSRAFWVDHAFQPSNWSFYCSAEARRNILIGGSVQLQDPAEHASAFAAEREEREFMISRLRPIMAGHGADGLESYRPEDLRSVVRAIWAHPQARELLLQPGAEASRGQQLDRLALIADSSRDEHEAVWVVALQRPACGGSPTRTLLFEPAGSSPYRLSPLSLRRLTGGPVPVSPDPSLDQPGGALATVRRFVLRRALACSCPVKTGVIFGCRARVLRASLLHAPPVVACDDLLSHHDVAAASSRGSALPPVSAWHRPWPGTANVAEGADGVALDGPPPAGVEVAEFARDGGGDLPFPIAWFNFAAGAEGVELSRGYSAPAAPGGAWQPSWQRLKYDPETGELECEVECRTIRHVFIKLIAPENRMAERNDDHTEANIDIEYCGLHGCLIPEEIRSSFLSK